MSSTNQVSVKYYYKTPNAPGNGASSSWSGRVKGNTESAILEVLRKKHKGKEIILREVKWK